MTFTEAAAEVLRLVGRPLHYKEITDIAIEKNLLSHVGKSPEVTMGARLAALLKKTSKENPLVRVKPGVFALREWDDSAVQAGVPDKSAGQRTLPDGSASAGGASAAGASADAGAAMTGMGGVADEGVGDSSEPPPPTADAEVEPDEEAAPADWEEEPEAETSPDELMRAEMAAAGAEVFDEEEDDDRPILGGDAPPAATAAEGPSQRRRRRRRRGRGRATTEGAGFPAGGLPSYTVTPAFPDGQGGGAPPPAVVLEVPVRAPSTPDVAQPTEMQVPLDDLAGRDLADSVAFLLNTLDRNGGQVALRHVAENAQRRGRVLGDLSQVQAQIAAAIRADNARRFANGQRMRFRFSGGKVGLTDWLLGGELARLEAEAQAAVERYREASRRVLLRKIQELPGHAFIELALLVLERTGVGQLRAIRRPGMPGGEAHFAAVQKSALAEIKTAIVIRRDGREVGRERVADLRGSLHHYGGAAAGILLTTGQVLSGAREECSSPGALPIALCDGVGFARLCEENDVAVIRARLPIALPDIDMLDALRST